MTQNKLVEIPVKDWPKIRDLYAHKKLETNSYQLFENYTNWVKKDPSVKESLKAYSLNGDWSDGTFIFQQRHGSSYYSGVNTLADSQERLLAALHCLKGGASTFRGCPIKVKPTIEAFLRESGINTEPNPDLNIHELFHIAPEEALEFKINPPDGVTLSSISPEYSDFINDHWAFKYPGSEILMARLLKFSTNIGAFDESGQLIAWCLYYPFGALGPLQVLETHKRRGLGSLVVRAISKKLGEQGIHIFAGVLRHNTASYNMFKSVGFKVIDQILIFDTPERK